MNAILFTLGVLFALPHGRWTYVAYVMLAGMVLVAQVRGKTKK